MSGGRSREWVQVGDKVVAQDGPVGHVDHVIRSESSVPAYLVIAVGRRIRRRYPIVPWDLVATVDESRRLVHIRGARGLLGRLPETPPLVV